jgi:hypothetical protein
MMRKAEDLFAGGAGLRESVIFRKHSGGRDRTYPQAPG